MLPIAGFFREGPALTTSNWSFYFIALSLNGCLVFLGHLYRVLWTINEGKKFHWLSFGAKQGRRMEVCFGHD